MGKPQVIHAIVALADNRHQGIVPVPARIGNGDDPENNLYWGCSEGVRSWFSDSRLWHRLSEQRFSVGPVLRRCVFQHRGSGTYLLADAYRGQEIRQATTDLLNEATGKIKTPYGTPVLVAYIGHNGLMDFSLPGVPNPTPAHALKTIVLCCKSQSYFAAPLRQAGATSLLLTTQLMYPGAFVLHDCLEAFFAGGGRNELRESAARAYARNQKISLKAARGVFA